MTSIRSASSRAHLGLFLIRAIVGVVFVFHGSQKLFGWFGGYGIAGTGQFMEGIGIPFGVASAVLVGVTELIGGLALLTGAWSRIAAVVLAFTMLVASFTAHGGAFSLASNGMEYSLTLALVSAGLAGTGPGAWTVAALRGARTVAPARVSLRS